MLIVIYRNRSRPWERRQLRAKPKITTIRDQANKTHYKRKKRLELNIVTVNIIRYLGIEQSVSFV